MMEASGWRQFVILLYKGYLLRKRHYIVTFFEIVIPILITCTPSIILYFSLPYMYGTLRRPDLDKYTTYEPFDPFFNEISTDHHLQFVYAPGNPVTDQFMQEAIKLFKTKTAYSGKITSKGTKNEKELESYCLFQQQEDSTSIIIGTIFKDFENKVPVSLDYKIRYSSAYNGINFFTQLKYRVNGPWYHTYGDDFPATLCMNCIEIWMQHFPYPEHRGTSGFSLINTFPLVIGYGYLIFIINIVRRMIEEKTNGSKELFKMMGMTDFTYWASTFMNYFIIGSITLLIITIVHKFHLLHGAAFLKNSDFFLVYILLCLFMASLILFCMLFSIFFTRTARDAFSSPSFYSWDSAIEEPLPPLSTNNLDFGHNSSLNTLLFQEVQTYSVILSCLIQMTLISFLKVTYSWQWLNLEQHPSDPDADPYGNPERLSATISSKVPHEHSQEANGMFLSRQEKMTQCSHIISGAPER
ncbi:ATP-binding cassette sub-family A member 3 [Nephila pilipes]|uniref:ATP-binding cassette sub-family A member 3 n=1 Tax=Nephila pilipes TaxID=299642 RepID=A0A8X6TY26_NEPPI|nr:ATP-binding cassette sub-family A member 3 [Nephila pilipes]